MSVLAAPMYGFTDQQRIHYRCLLLARMGTSCRCADVGVAGIPGEHGVMVFVKWQSIDGPFMMRLKGMFRHTIAIDPDLAKSLIDVAPQIGAHHDCLMTVEVPT